LADKVLPRLAVTCSSKRKRPRTYLVLNFDLFFVRRDYARISFPSVKVFVFISATLETTAHRFLLHFELRG